MQTRAKKLIPNLLLLTGLAGMILAFGADLFRMGGDSGAGIRQFLMGGVSLAVGVMGVFLLTRVGRRLLDESLVPGEQWTKPVAVLIVTIWFGLLAGLSEASILLYRRILEGRVINRSLHIAWMAPVGDVLLFLLPGLILFLVALRRPGRASLRSVVLLSTFLAAASVLFLLPRLHNLAVLLLAAGIAIQASRVAGKWPGRFFNLIRLTLPLLAFIVLFLFIAVYSWQGLKEYQARAQYPPAAKGAPNVVLVVLDTVRASNMSLYGYSRPTTPELERLAQKGVTFDRAYSTAPWTLPSHASMFTGRWHFESGGLDTPLDTDNLRLAEFFSRQGYDTAGFVANVFYGSYEHGLDRGFSHYEDYMVNLREILLTPTLVREMVGRLQPVIGFNRFYMPKTAEDVNTSFLHWAKNQNGQPFFAFLNYIDAHNPYLPPKPYDARFGNPRQRANHPDGPEWLWTDKEIQAEVDAYDGALAYLDAQVGSLYNELERSGLAENTLVIIVSDHGEQLGEHKIFNHANSLYVQSLHVPLVILYPKEVPAGQRVSIPVSLRDLPATIVDLLHLERSSKFPGQSLAKVWQGAQVVNSGADEMIPGELFYSKDATRPSWYPINSGDMQSLIAGQFHFILNGDGRVELYDLASDPSELHNLAGSNERVKQIEDLRRSLEQLVSDQPPVSRQTGGDLGLQITVGKTK